MRNTQTLAELGVTSEPLSWATGSEIIGLDLTRPEAIPEPVFPALWRELGERGILLFRGRKLSHAQHVDFTRRFGPLADTGMLSRYAPAGYPDIFTVTNTRTEGGTRSETWNAARQWHADQSFLPVPARASLLYCDECPRVGGDTMFANAYQAHDALSEGLRKTLEGMRAYHTLLNTRATVLNGRAPPTEEERKKISGTYHPVIDTHPETGRKYLFVSEQMVDCFEGWSIADSAPLLDYLYALQARPEYTYRHHWRPGDIVMWDNRCTMHMAPEDYDVDRVDAPENRRMMFRTTLA